MTVRSLLPPVNATGLFELLEPFKLEAGLVYVCEEVRSFDELTRLGKKVFSEYYEPLQLTEDEYKRDVELEAAIVTLKAGGELPVYVPSTYILNYPGFKNRGYENKIIALEIGLLPLGTDISTLKTELADHAKATLGIDANVYEANHLFENDLTAQQQADLERARRLAITNYIPKDVRIKNLEEQIDKLQQQNEALVAVIIQKEEESQNP